MSNSDAQCISGSEDGHIYIWDVMEGNVVSKLSGHSKAVCCVAYHPKEAKLISAGTDGVLKVWGTEADCL